MRWFVVVCGFLLFTITLIQGCALSHERPNYHVTVDCTSIASLITSELATPQSLADLYQITIIPQERPVAAVFLTVELQGLESPDSDAFFRRFGDWYVTSGSAYTRLTAHGPQPLMPVRDHINRARVTLMTPTVGSSWPIPFTIRSDLLEPISDDVRPTRFVVSLDDIGLVYSDNGVSVPWEEIEFISCDSASSHIYTLN